MRGKFIALLLIIPLLVTSCIVEQVSSPNPVNRIFTATFQAPIPSDTPVPTSKPTATKTPTPINTPTITPTKAPEAISPQNVSRLTRFAFLGNGDTENASVSPDHKTIAVASTLGVILYDTETFEKIKIIEPDQTTYIAFFSPDGTKLAIGMPNALILEDEAERITAVEVWDIRTNTRLYRFEGYPDFWHMNSLTFSPDGCQIIDRGEVVHNICNNANSKRTGNDWRNPTAVFSPDGTKAIVWQGGWSLWNIQQNIKIRDLVIRASLEFSVTYITRGLPIFSPDGNTVASYQANHIYLLDSNQYKQFSDYKLNAAVKSLTYSPDSKYLLAFGEDNKLHLISAASGELMGESDVLPYEPLATTFSPDSKYVTALDDYINIFRWKTPEMKLEKTHTDMPFKSHAAFSKDGKYLAVASCGYSHNSGKYFPSKNIIFDANTFKQIYQLGETCGNLAFSPDSHILAATESPSGFVNLWDVETGKLLKTLEVMKGKQLKASDLIGYLDGVAFSSDGKTVAVVNAFQNRLYLWNADSGELIDGYTLPNYRNPNGRMMDPPLHPDQVIFTSDGSKLILIEGNAGFVWDRTKKLWVDYVPQMTSNPPKTIFINVGCYFYDNNNKVISKIRNEFCLSTTLNFINREEDNIVTGKRLRRYHWADQFIFSPNGNVLMQTSQASVIIYWHIE